MFYIFNSNSYNPYKNLAIEDFLVNFANENQHFILYFWQNENTVVIGRNQDAFSEVNLDFMIKNKIKLARRKTGGGAVFHDKNNLNFSFIIPKNRFNKLKSSNIIKKALFNLGIDSEISGRNDILVNNKKISGNAYLNKENVTLHHGTILLNTNFELLENVLNINTVKLQSHGVKSVKNRVLNLNELYPNITIKDLKQEIKKEFENTYLNKCQLFKDDLQIEKDFYSSEEWIYGDKKFINLKKYSHKFDWGICEIKILNSKEKKYVKIYSDALEYDFISNAEYLINSNNMQNKNIDKEIIEIFEFCNNLLTLQ